MTAQELREKYLKFFESKGHSIIPSASLIPRETDASTLFTTAGMHPLVPYLMGEQHPGGKRVVNVQKCVRTGDIDEVGDNRHLTFFEMLGNWSFGDYFKKEAIKWSFEFLTDKKWLGLDKNRLYVTVFKGDPPAGGEIPKDEESIAVWQDVFEKAEISADVAGEDEVIKENIRIISLGTEDNFWIAGKTGPCGGDTEMFYDTRPNEGEINGKFSDLVNSGRLIEIWNDVFMEFDKKENGTVEKLKQHNVDTGMGVERTLAVLNGKENVFETELFQPIFEKIEELTGKKYKGNEKLFRIVADHIKASVFLLADGIEPSNKGRGYILRRLIRRAVAFINIEDKEFDSKKFKSIAQVVLDIYKDTYQELKQENILEKFSVEIRKFRATIENGLKEFNKGVDPFILFTTYGFPIELTKELAKEKGIEINENDFNRKLKEHQELSKTASAGMFKGGLQDTSDETKKLHTAAHLMLAALRQVLGNHVIQKGSNITAERLRFDFLHPEKMTPEQIKKIEELVNAAIETHLDVIREEMTLDEARRINAMGVFDSKYGDKVSVYCIADDKARLVSREICGGPHVKNTGELGHFKITKEESSSAGVRRIKAILE